MNKIYRKWAMVLAILCLSMAGNLQAQNSEQGKLVAISMSPFSDSRNHWYGIRDANNIVNPVANQPKYPESEIIKIADNILLYQRENGGWPKNYDMQAILTPQQIDSLVKTKAQHHTTFDNATTYTHVEYLAQVYTQTSIEKYKKAALKGLQFILDAQYANGGWPQYFPLEPKNYSSHITFNDGAFIGVMETLKKIRENDQMFSFVNAEMRKKASIAFDKGLECILKCQIVSKGRLTAWCQQHNEFDLKPAWARAYEMPSISNGESVQIVLFLMSLDKPDQRIITAIQSAVKWFGESRIYNTRVVTIQAPPEESQWRTNRTDRIVVTDSTAAPIWTRFYELETEKPLFSDRNSKMLYSLAEVGRERRSGYAWYTYAPQMALDKYPEWQKKWVPGLAVSANGRYLTSGGKPFFWLGDTGWMILEKLNKGETEIYFEDRRKKGFNVIQIMLLHALNAVTVDGDSALIHKNVSRPNLVPAVQYDNGFKIGYWENLDFVVNLAAQKGISLALVPIWGSNVRAGLVSSEQAEIYAKFLANRYKYCSNVIWMNGGDVRGDDSIKIWKIIGNTLKKENPKHLVTYHPFGRTQSSKWFHNEAWLDVNMCQSGHRDYLQDTSRIDLHFGEDNWRYIQSDYSRHPIKPTLDGEPSYEGIPHGLHDTLQPRWTDSDLRRYAYWSVFAGACGFTYGNNAVMQLHKKGEKTGAYGANESWEEAIHAPGAGQMIHLKNLMLKYHFEELVPDQFVLSNQGERYNHLSSLKGKNCWLVYTYNGRMIQLDGSKLSGSKFRYSWYSPRDGKSEKGGEMIKSEKFEFDPPGEQKEGNDWVLIVEKVQ